MRTNEETGQLKPGGRLSSQPQCAGCRQQSPNRWAHDNRRLYCARCWEEIVAFNWTDPKADAYELHISHLEVGNFSVGV